MNTRYRLDHFFTWFTRLVLGLVICSFLGLFAHLATLSVPALKRTSLYIGLAYKANPHPLKAVTMHLGDVLQTDDYPSILGLLSPGLRFETPKKGWVLASAELGLYHQDPKQNKHLLTPTQRAFYQALIKQKAIKTQWDISGLFRSDSREPELAGVGGGLISLLYIMLTIMIFGLPLALGCALYFEFYNTHSRSMRLAGALTQNLAATPSILFGLLGYILFLQFMGLPRSSSLVGGLVLTLMALPIMIVTFREAINTIPQSILLASYSLGASKRQTIATHVLPTIVPQLITGTLLSVARIIGEVAPLILVGMAGFIPDKPTSITDPAAPLSVQIYLWATSAERGFVAKTALAVLVALALLCFFSLLGTLIKRLTDKGHPTP
jgi:phosphate transport system permease protein